MDIEVLHSRGTRHSTYRNREMLYVQAVSREDPYMIATDLIASSTFMHPAVLNYARKTDTYGAAEMLNWQRRF
jgi:hypothetical protein